MRVENFKQVDPARFSSGSEDSLEGQMNRLTRKMKEDERYLINLAIWVQNAERETAPLKTLALSFSRNV